MLTRLAAIDPTAAELAKLRFFGGLSVEEAGDALGVPRATAYRNWTYARAWLRRAGRRAGEIISEIVETRPAGNAH